MLILPSPELLAQVQEKYTPEFLCKVFQKMQVTDLSEQQSFAKTAILAGAGYLQFLENNKDRLQPHAQIENLDNYQKALETVKKCYGAINRDNPTRTKFHDTLQDEYNHQTTQMREMLFPYQDKAGYSETIFINFLDVLINVCEKAKTRNIGGDKSILSDNALTWWIAVIGHNWSKSSPVKFIVGDYKSPAREVLFLLMGKIDSITEPNIKTAMRKVVVKGQVKNPAELLLK